MLNKKVLFLVQIELEIIISHWIWIVVCFSGDLCGKAVASTTKSVSKTITAYRDSIYVPADRLAFQCCITQQPPPPASL